MSGAAIATVLAYLAMVIAIWFFNRKYYPIKYDWYKIGAIIVLTAAAYLVAIWGDSVIYRVIFLNRVIGNWWNSSLAIEG